MTADPIHTAEGDTPMRDGYMYASTGAGVRRDLVDAVMAKWASVSPYGDAARTLKSVNDGALNSVDNIARMAVEATLKGLGYE
jgi:hypothetical protein